MAASGEVNLWLNAKGTALAALKTLQSQLSNFQTTFRAGFNLNLGAQAANLLLSLPGHAARLGRSAMEMADKLENQSRALGVSATTLQVYNLAVEKAGGKEDTFTKSLENTNRALAEALKGSVGMRDSFEALGLNAAKLSELPVAERMEALGAALQKGNGRLDANAAAARILGQRDLPQLSRALQDVAEKGFGKFSKEAEDSWQVLDKASRDALSAAKRNLDDLERRAVVTFGKLAGAAMALYDDPKKTALGLGQLWAGGGASILRGQIEARNKPDPDPAPAPPPMANEEERLKARLQFIDEARQGLSSDPIRTELQKRKELVAVLEEQAATLSELLDLKYSDVIALDPSGEITAEQLTRLREKSDLEAKITATLNERDAAAGRGPRAIVGIRERANVEDPTVNKNYLSIGEGFEAGALSYLNEIGSTGEQIAQTLNDTIGATVRGISEGIMGWITGAQNFAQVAQQFGLSVLQQTLDTVVQIGIKQVLNGNAAKAIALGWKALTSSLRAADTAETIAAEGAKTPILMANAAASSASSFGLSAVIGIAALAAALGAFLAGFEEGGYTGAGGKSEPAGIVHRGEYVLTSDEVNRLGIGRIERFKNLRGYEMGGLVSAPSSSGRSSSRSRTRDRQPIFVDSERAARSIAQHSDAEADIQRIVYANRHQLFT